MSESGLRMVLRSFFEQSRAFKTRMAVMVDLLAITCSIILTLILREHSAEMVFSGEVFRYIFATTILSVISFHFFGLYRTILRSIGESAVFQIFLCTLFASAIWTIFYSMIESFDLRTTITVWAFLIISVGLPRLLVRNIIFTLNRKGSKNVIIFGAGEAGRQLAHAIKLEPKYRIIAFVDNNVELYGTLINGCKVYPEAALESLVKRKDVDRVLLAMPSVSRSRRYKIIKNLEKLPVTIKSVTSMADIVSGKAKLEELKDIDIEDILGREPVEPDNSLLRAHNTNKCVLVSGAGGSIGSELSRQLIKLGPAKLILFDVSEFAVYEISQELEKLKRTKGLLTQLVQIVGSVQNVNLLHHIFKEYRVQTVYHAAAYKHVPIVENNIAQGFLNNVIGTWNIASAAEQFNAEKFILISTDKAVRPTNFMGASKRMAELVLQAMAQENSDFHCGIVRFGNVLGSSGSVVPLFKEQIETGGPITVTHPEVTRYFMTIPESAQLVIQAGAMGSHADVYVLDMGDPVKIADLAEEMVRLSGLVVKDEQHPDGDIEIRFTGLRQGEKLYEELLVGEDTSGTQHQRILSAREKFHDWKLMKQGLTRLQSYIDSNDIDGIFKLLQELDIDFNQQYPISDPFYKKPIDTSSNVIKLPSGTDSPSVRG